MPSRIALAGCALWPAGSGDHAGLTEALAARGVSASWVPWDALDVDWAEYELVVLRETWDYPPKLASFLAWVEVVAQATAVVNPPAVVRWNHHKGYLLELARAGVPVVPTGVVAAGADARAALSAAGAGPVVVKPAVGVGGNDAQRGDPADPAFAAHLRAVLGSGDALVQPYQATVATVGETSVVVLGGSVSHAVAKLPAAGEFRVHEHRGGTYAQVEPSSAQVEVALHACDAARAATGQDLLYARADLVAGDDGRPLLMELELIEPSLYLHTVPAATGHFADLITATVRP